MKVLSLAVIAILMLACVFVVSGCGDNKEANEKAIRDALTEQLNGFKNHDAAFVNEFTDFSNADALAEYGIDPQALVDSYLEGADYNIQSVEVDGDTATAVFTLTCKSYKQFEEDITNAVTALISDTAALESLANEDAMKNKVAEITTQTIDNLTPVTTEPITYVYHQKGDNWVLDESESGSIADALMSV